MRWGRETLGARENVKGARAVSTGDRAESVASGYQSVDGRDESAAGG